VHGLGQAQLGADRAGERALAVVLHGLERLVVGGVEARIVARQYQVIGSKLLLLKLWLTERERAHTRVRALSHLPHDNHDDDIHNIRD